MKTIDITIRKNSKRISFTEFGVTFIPPYIGIANTEKGLEHEHHNGDPDVELGKEFGRSIKGYRHYTYLSDPKDVDYCFIDAEKGLTIDLCGTVITVKQDSRLHIEHKANGWYE